MPKEALSLDLDGVIIGRIPFQWTAFSRLLKRSPIDFSSPEEISPLDRTIAVEKSLTVGDRINYLRHSMPVTREARQVIPQLAETMDIYANSGRINTTAWNKRLH